MLNKKNIYLVGYASGAGGAYATSAEGPLVLRDSTLFNDLVKKGIKLHWDEMIQSENPQLTKHDVVVQLCTRLSSQVSRLMSQEKFFLVLGGDHTCAIGTWSGVSLNLTDSQALGLIWIDAHMDSHTPQTSLTGNIHGMPLASLLGQGDPQLITMGRKSPILYPENVCLIGVRSYESGEQELLQKLNVKIFYMDEIKARGLDAVMRDAIAHVKRNTKYFGVSLDIDSIDPKDAPGTGVKEANGIAAVEMLQSLKLLADEEKLIGFEIVEFDPARDQGQKTEKLCAELVLSICE